ncbi:ABC transporter permease [Thiolapillus brandeum]|uniref:Sodium ABC transporter permease n=1 Tax=Thiolapillus brandeum TaxID=1076588 RepID=A0A7U6GL90_9GAMM|nr:ABC transporter permease [Thiolapillus brandeum]BAO45731.1 sodium ABC transporter permease [Thiolapillus brandeum]
MKPWFIVFRKELKDLSRDRRTMTNILVLGALLGPVLAMGLLMLTMKMVADEAEKTIRLPVQGAQYAPVLLDYLAYSRIQVDEPVEDPAGAVRSQEVEAVLEIPPDFGERLRQGRPAELTLISDHSRTRARIARSRIESAIQGYSSAIGSLRLSLRGIDPVISQVITLHDQDLSPDGGAAALLSFLPYLLIIGIMQAAMVVAADLTAGERERQSLEPLMANPVAPEQIMAGKLATNVLVSLAVLLLSLGGFALGSRMVDIGEAGLNFSLWSIPLLLTFLAPLAFMFAALMSFVGAFARTVKEAQTYLSLLVLAALMPSMLQMVLQSRVQGSQLLLPIWSHNYLINEVLRGESLAWTEWLLPSAGALFAGVAFAFLAARLYRKPGFIF